MDSRSTNDAIAHYYTESNWLYKYFWYSKKSLAMHYGFWQSDTTSRDNALINQYKEIIRLGKISSTSKVLDAGCGVGGASIYIAKQTGASVTAITITPLQVTECKKNVQHAGTKTVHCQLADYINTSLPSDTFDVIFGIESVCHAYPKSAFLKEAYRLLKKDGLLIISDGYAAHSPKTTVEKQTINTFCRGWELSELIPVSLMNLAIEKAGFKLLHNIDRTSQVKPTLIQMQQLISMVAPITWLLQRLKLPISQPILRNIDAIQMSITGVHTGLMGYWTQVACKQ